MEIPTLKIEKEGDIELLSIEKEEFNLEIYVHNSVIELSEIRGNLIVRAVNCSFPNLKIVEGNLSIDAKQVTFPVLKIVKGNLNIHEKEIELPKLERVIGKLKMYSPTKLDNLLSNNSSNHTDTWVEISKPSEIHNVKDYQYNNIRIKITDTAFFRKKKIEFTMKEHFGSIEIINTNCIFPNLRKIYGSLIIKENDSKKVHTPKLDIIKKRCVINSANQRILVKTIKGKLLIEKGLNNKFPTLETVGKLTITRNGSELIAPKLKEIKKQSSLYGDLRAESLEILNIDYSYQFNHYLPNLRILNGNIRRPNLVEKSFCFEKLEIINGDYFLCDSIETPNLKHIYGRLILSDKKVSRCRKMQTIGELQGSKELKEQFVKENNTISRINTSEYFQVDNSKLVKNYYHIIRENQRLSNNYFYLGFRWRNNQVPILLETYVRILKMRHKSFQNFYVREVKREWICDVNDHLFNILKKIEKLWDTLIAYNYEELFTIKDISIRRFSFNYVGVGEMMKALKAKRISSDGVLVSHFKYNENGDKITEKKHNIFETYEANLNFIKDLETWNSQMAYAVKCWCTSTNQEHWLWIEKKYKDDPLAAIASTFRIHENVIPYIKCLKRQGDILLCEMKVKILPEGKVRPLTKEEYFGLLIAES